MTSPFDRTHRPSIFADDPAFKAPRTVKATEAARDAFKKRKTVENSWLTTNTVIAYSKAVPRKKGTK